MEVNKMNKTLRKEMKVKKMQNGKSVKTGSDFLSQAKKKVSDLLKPTGKSIPTR
jgi:exonuclease VII small subunit